MDCCPGGLHITVVFVLVPIPHTRIEQQLLFAFVAVLPVGHAAGRFGFTVVPAGQVKQQLLLASVVVLPAGHAAGRFGFTVVPAGQVGGIH